MVGNTDKDRPEKVTLNLAKGYIDKLDKIKDERHLKARPQVIEFLTDNALGSIDFKLERLKINNKINEYLAEINNLRDKLMELDDVEAKVDLRKEVEREKMVDKLYDIKETLMELKQMNYSKDEIILRGKNLSLAYGVNFKHIQKLIDSL